ncbi:unnamed protein product, partial [Ectocarpus sp. 12 AP-2014]
ESKTNILCTYEYDGYASYRIAKQLTTKAETSLMESKNSFIRHYLARLNRRTKRFSKTYLTTLSSFLLIY